MTTIAPSDVADLVLRRTLELGVVPAPPLREQRRARLVADWWRDDGLGDVTIDATGNVWARVRAGRGADAAATLVCAHLDTVFDDDVEHRFEREGDRLRGPGVGDDTVAVAALGALDALLPDALDHPVWVLATVGEEGYGNLAGITGALDAPLAAPRAVVALEGNYLGRVCRVGVGSVRWRVQLRGPGGHAWEAADAPSAVHALGHVVAALDTLSRPAGARTSVNVGLASGGEAINARARQASFELDVRADDGDALDALADAAVATITEVAARHGIEASFEERGRRPAGAIDPDHALVRCAAEQLRAIGYEPRFTAASTDANVAHSRGIPAVTLGVTEGAGEHTPEEWIAVPPLAAGLQALAATIAAYDAVG